MVNGRFRQDPVTKIEDMMARLGLMQQGEAFVVGVRAHVLGPLGRRGIVLDVVQQA